MDVQNGTLHGATRPPPSMSVLIIDHQGGSVRNFHVTVTGAVTLDVEVINSSSTQVPTLDIVIIFDVSANALITFNWESNVWWPGNPPNTTFDILDTYGAGANDIRVKVHLTTFDNGSVWYADWDEYPLVIEGGV